MKMAAQRIISMAAALATLLYILGDLQFHKDVRHAPARHARVQTHLARRVLDEKAQYQPSPTLDAAYQVEGFDFYRAHDLRHCDILCTSLDSQTALNVSQHCRRTPKCTGFTIFQRPLDRGPQYCLKYHVAPLTPANGTAGGTECMSRPSNGVYIARGASFDGQQASIPQRQVCQFMNWGGICHSEEHSCICVEVDDATGRPYYRAAYFCEFGYEMVLFAPWTHFLHSKGLLRETAGSLGSEVLHPFSPKHIVVPVQGRMHPCGGIPAHYSLHEHDFRSDYQWSPPDYAAVYSTPEISSALVSASLAAAPNIDGSAWPNLGDPSAHRELLIIHNKFALEWGSRPVNFLDLPTLEALFLMLQDRYQVLYINAGLLSVKSINHPDDPWLIQGENIGFADDTAHFQLNDTELLQRFPKVLPIHHLVPRYAKLFTYNELIFALHARCKRFISVQGGNSIMASYFGGTNLIYFKVGGDMHDFTSTYPQLAHTTVYVAENYTALLGLAREHYMS